MTLSDEMQAALDSDKSGTALDLKGRLRDWVVRVRGLERDMAQFEQGAYPAYGSELQKLGAFLADYLDADHFNNVEPVLLAVQQQLTAKDARIAELESAFR